MNNQHSLSSITFRNHHDLQPDSNPRMITYENISMVKGKEPRSIWWRPDPGALRDARPLRFGLQKCGFNQQTWAFIVELCWFTISDADLTGDQFTNWWFDCERIATLMMNNYIYTYICMCIYVYIYISGDFCDFRIYTWDSGPFTTICIWDL